MVEFELLAKIVENLTGTPKQELISKVRSRPLVELRIICSNILKEYRPSLTVNKIGSVLNINHATVSYYKKSHKILMGQKNGKYKELYEKVNDEFSQNQPLGENNIKSELLEKREKLERMIADIDKILNKMKESELHELKT